MVIVCCQYSTLESHIEHTSPNIDYDALSRRANSDHLQVMHFRQACGRQLTTRLHDSCSFIPKWEQADEEKDVLISSSSQSTSRNSLVFPITTKEHRREAGPKETNITCLNSLLYHIPTRNKPSIILNSRKSPSRTQLSSPTTTISSSPIPQHDIGDHRGTGRQPHTQLPSPASMGEQTEERKTAYLKRPPIHLPTGNYISTESPLFYIRPMMT
ncbi:uncharacterized protein K489DRAFT_136915 [Dissoconium aciculare CBS 342.82]|uniref:Uncharacterized protein n=1 Tax=Dissoconium aciculare CBS 342.82 TaxID=1314786 RepID=A0A6J3LTF8_9PEZI|nr:uncharacterized protein K489DRAFT_136915 [Dissoconium aciculare CBS 342.82]KAF1817902.1 hypothetical protein K489DRAFT_136915 [Dissoconium aciculare CBS 342.82]